MRSRRLKFNFRNFREMSTLTATSLENRWNSEKTTMNSAKKIALLGDIRKLITTGNPTDKSRLSKLLREIAGSIQTPKSRPIFTLRADIKDLLEESQSQALRIQDQELQVAVEQQTSAIKNVSAQLVNISKTLNPSQSGKLEDQRLTPEQVKKVKDMFVGDLNTQWTDIIGNEEGKNILKRVLVLPTKQPKFTANIKPGKGILLFGPPGTGKTFLARAAATELAKSVANSRFIEVQPSKILGSYVGDTEKNISAIFTVARKYFNNGTDLVEGKEDDLKGYFTIVFFDEIDGIAPSKSSSGVQDYTIRQVNQLLVEMGGLDQSGAQVYFIAATNYPARVESAILRRVGTRVYVPPPLPDERWEVLVYYLGEKEKIALAKETDSTKKAKLQELIDYKQQYLDLIIPMKNKIKAKTAWYSNSDLEVLAQAILSSTVDWGLSHYWEPTDSSKTAYNMTKDSIYDKSDKMKQTVENKSYKTILQLGTDAALPQNPNADHINPVIEKSKRSVTDLKDLYQMEWYAIGGELLTVPSLKEFKNNVDPKSSLFTVFVYHMYRFGTGIDEDYGKELAFLTWRCILNEATLNDDAKKWEVIERLWGGDLDSWPNSYSSTRKSVNPKWDDPKWTGISISDEFKKKIKSLHSEFKK
jgi:SpoVK/Ycf46/Vps4 family AAA+-type ATPase